MSITVRDCLSLPSLASARVVAGYQGLDSVVKAISVIEFDDYEDAYDAFLDDEDVWDDY